MFESKNLVLGAALLLLLDSSCRPVCSFTSHSSIQPPLLKRNIAFELSSVAPTNELKLELDTGKGEEVEEVKESLYAPFVSPGIVEDDKFDCDESVLFWRNFQNNNKDDNDSSNTASTSANSNNNSITWQQNALQMADISNRFASSRDPQKVNYFLKHVARSGYFVTNALLGNAGFQLHERFIAQNDKEKSSSSSSVLPLNLSSDVGSRILLEALLCYEQDYESISKGIYRNPWDMRNGHRQSSPINVVTQTGRFVQEAVGTLVRRNRRQDKDKRVAFFQEPEAPSLYPDYYRNAFHWQTNGWMSQDSANVYETSTETLFLGRQDAMQRISLVPIIAQSKKLEAETGTQQAQGQQQSSSEKRKPMRVLEIACGTGRFMTFVRDNLPLDTEYAAIDLSPFYLEKARDNDAYWRKTRLNQETEEQGTTNGKSNAVTTIPPAKLIQANAESLPFENESFDAVLCVYLFHELPREARAQVASEMARVSKVGGTVVLTDSMQKGDRPPLDGALQNFEKMNEPYYIDYTLDDLPSHFEKAGLTPMEKAVRSSTKMLSFRKEEKYHKD